MSSETPGKNSKPAPRRQLLWLLFILLINLPAFYHGWQHRFSFYGDIVANEPLSSDATGFIELAKRGLQWTYSWREPLFPQLLAGVSQFSDISVEASHRTVVLTASCLVPLVVFVFSFSLGGGLVATVATYLTAYSPWHLLTLRYGERSDVYLILLLLGWTALAQRRWFWCAGLAALATYLRLTSFATFFASVCCWYLVTQIRLRDDIGAIFHGISRQVRAHWKAPAGALLLYVCLTIPLFSYYQLYFDSWLYPQRLVYYDYYVHSTQNEWFIDVTGNFERSYEVPDDFSYGDFFTGAEDFIEKMKEGLRRIFVPRLSDDFSGSYVSFPHALFSLFYVLGLLFLWNTYGGRVTAAVFVAYSLPFVSLAFLPELNRRFFIPTLTLAFVIAGFGVQGLADFSVRYGGRKEERMRGRQQQPPPPENT